MKQSLFMMALVLFSTGCGVLKVNPKSCKTDAIWDASINSSRSYTLGNVELEEVIEIKAKEQFLVFYDTELELKELLLEHDIECSDVKRLRLIMSTSWFFWREVSLKVVKN